VALGVRADRVTVTGDTRFDQAWRRANAVDRAAPFLAPLLGGGRFTLVAGSTWPADEAVLLEAWVAVRRQNPRARLIVAPHEPTDAHLAAIERWAVANRAPLARLSDVESGAVSGADVVLVDRVGVLAELYAAGSAAFVGGGFHDAGLHSVLEPAACACPCASAAPHEQPRRGLLLAAGGAITGATPRVLAEQIKRWMSSEALRAHAGGAARGVVEAGLGGRADVGDGGAAARTPGLTRRRAPAGAGRTPAPGGRPSPCTVSNSSARSTPSAITIAPWSFANRTIVSTRFCLMKFVSMQLMSDMSSLMKSARGSRSSPSPA
jgi:hypothetical protein